MRVEQEDDLLVGHAVIVVAAAVVVLAILLSLWAYLVLRSDERAIRPTAGFPERDLPRPTEVSGIEQEAFGQRPSQAERTALRARQRLGSYGWVDRDARTVHIPIERAVELYLSKEGAP